MDKDRAETIVHGVGNPAVRSMFDGQEIAYETHTTYNDEFVIISFYDHTSLASTPKDGQLVLCGLTCPDTVFWCIVDTENVKVLDSDVLDYAWVGYEGDPLLITVGYRRRSNQLLKNRHEEANNTKDLR